MKIKFIRALVIVLVCLIMFLSTTYVPSVKNLSGADFLQGFSAGAGVVALVATIYYYIESRKATGQV